MEPGKLIIGEEGIVTDFAGMWFTLSVIALFTAALFAFAFEDQTDVDLIEDPA